MRILFIGGTRFVGLAMAREALRRGHRVDLFHRGQTRATDLPGANHLLGDRTADLSALAHGEWDAIIDVCAYWPHEIEVLADTLKGRGGRYCFISTVSVYADEVPPNSRENARRADTSALPLAKLATVPRNAETYGPLKVLCEEAVLRHHESPLIIRPTYVIGPEDYTQRFPEWVRRISAGGTVDAPEPRDEPIQYIDARDLASFVIRALEADLRGVFNTATPNPPFSFEDLLHGIAAAVGPPGTSLRWIPVDEAKAPDRSFPLWGGGIYSGVSAVNSDAAAAHGLVCRPLSESTRDVLKWIKST